jgi:hypothetical protein
MLVLSYLAGSAAFVVGALYLIGPDLKNTLRNFQSQVLPAFTARF